MSIPDVVVVGGGVVGCSVAFHLARAGAAVALLERNDLASHASGAAAGMLAPICESTGEGPFFELALRSLRRFPDLAPELRELSGVDPQYVPSGVLRAAESEAEVRHLREQADRLAAYGLEWLDAEAARSRVPLLGEGVLGALWSPQEGHVYSPLMTRAYAGAAERLGAVIGRATPVTGLLRQGRRIAGVRSPAGDQAAGHVVLCAGAWTRFCGEWLDLSLPVDPVRGQILALDAPARGFRSIIWGEGVYLVPKRNGSVVVGATEEHAGFDCRLTGAGIAQLLAAATRLIPELGSCTFRHAWAGLRPDTPDHLPLIGPLAEVEGLSLAAGHYRNGVLLSPITGELVAEGVLRGEWAESAAPFRPERLLRARGAADG